MLEKPAAEERGGGLGPAGQHPSPGHPRRWGRLCFALLPAPGTYRPIFFRVVSWVSSATQQEGECLHPDNTEVVGAMRGGWGGSQLHSDRLDTFFTFFPSHVTSSLKTINKGVTLYRRGSVTSPYRYAAYAYAPVWLYVSEHWQIKKSDS